MFPYRVKYNESEYDIQNNDLLYKIHKKYQNTFAILENVGNVRKRNHNLKMLFCVLYKLHNSYFVNFVILYILYILYYTCRSLTFIYVHKSAHLWGETAGREICSACGTQLTFREKRGLGASARRCARNRVLRNPSLGMRNV